MPAVAEKSPEKRIFTVPNVLSMLRIVLIPIYAYLYLTAETNKDFYIAAGVMAFSMITDAFDGIIARKFNLITTLGKALDPVADKLTQAVVLVCLTIRFWHHKQFLILAGIFIVKETFMLIMGVLNLRKGKMLSGALIAGKVCTTVLFVGMALFMLCPNMSGTYVWVISMLCSAAMVVSLWFYVSTYMGADHGVQVVPLAEQNKKM